MTNTTNGWPGKPGVPLNPNQSRWHWLKGAASLSTPRPYLWEVFLGSGRWADERLNDPVILAEMEYIRPALPYGLTPEEATALQARVAELEAETKKAKFIHQYEVKELQARATKLTRLVEILVENDPEDMAADAVTVLDVWRKEARELLARHARLDARQTGMEKMREKESAEIRAALQGKKDE